MVAAHAAGRGLGVCCNLNPCGDCSGAADKEEAGGASCRYRVACGSGQRRKRVRRPLGAATWPQPGTLVPANGRVPCGRAAGAGHIAYPHTRPARARPLYALPEPQRGPRGPRQLRLFSRRRTLCGHSRHGTPRVPAAGCELAAGCATRAATRARLEPVPARRSHGARGPPHRPALQRALPQPNCVCRGLE